MTNKPSLARPSASISATTGSSLQPKTTATKRATLSSHTASLVGSLIDFATADENFANALETISNTAVTFAKRRISGPTLTTPAPFGRTNSNKLVKSLQEFPEMLEARPIVIDKDGTVLGGNMRLKAAQLAGLDEVPAH